VNTNKVKLLANWGIAIKKIGHKKTHPLSQCEKMNGVKNYRKHKTNVDL
jgi:hypothetical protein